MKPLSLDDLTNEHLADLFRSAGWIAQPSEKGIVVVMRNAVFVLRRAPGVLEVVTFLALPIEMSDHGVDGLRRLFNDSGKPATLVVHDGVRRIVVETQVVTTEDFDVSTFVARLESQDRGARLHLAFFDGLVEKEKANKEKPEGKSVIEGSPEELDPYGYAYR